MAVVVVGDFPDPQKVSGPVFAFIEICCYCICGGQYRAQYMAVVVAGGFPDPQKVISANILIGITA